MMDFTDECGFKSAAEDTLRMPAKVSQTMNVFHCVQKTYIGDGLRTGGI